MTLQITNQTQIEEWIEEMTYIEEHLNKISLSHYNYSISCLSCFWEISYSESKNLLVIDNRIRCPKCKGEKIRLKNQTSLRF
jgi:Zn finger protein HypA/HybF involved in hydrogenase expression